MSRGITFVIGAVLGLLVGGGAVLYFISPRGAASPIGRPIQPPDAQSSTAGTAAVQLRQEFFAPVLQTLLREGNSPSFPLNLSGQATDQPVNEIACGKITLKNEGSGTTTAVQMDTGQILVPIAFTGSFNALGNCFNFTGWAQANLELRYDDAQQAVFGQINVQSVNLDGVPPVVSGLVTPLVQSTLNNRVNPVQILRGDQIALKVPITSTNSQLQGNVKDMRAEVKDNSLFLFVTYDFGGASPTPATAQ